MRMELHPILESDVEPSIGLWYVLSAVGDKPSLRVGHTALYHSNNGGDDFSVKSGHVVVIGGANPSETFSDVHALNLKTLSWNMNPTSGFNARYEHIAFIPASQPNKVYVLAGANQQGNISDIQSYSINDNIWQTINTASGSAPSPRTHHTSAAIGDNVYIFSGGKSFVEPVQDRQVHCFNTRTLSWNSLAISGEAPAPRHGHSLTPLSLSPSSVHNKLVCFGGMASKKFYNDVHILDLEKSMWITPKIKKNKLPDPRAGHAAVCHKHKLFVFGGMNKEGQALNDLWKLDLLNFQWSLCTIEGAAPAPRLDMACCVLPWNGDMLDSTVMGGSSSAVTDESDELDDNRQPDPTDSRQSDPTDSRQSDSTDNRQPGPADSRQPDSTNDRQPDSIDDRQAGPVGRSACNLLLIHGGMDTQGEIFDDCLVIKLDNY